MLLAELFCARRHSNPLSMGLLTQPRRRPHHHYADTAATPAKLEEQPTPHIQPFDHVGITVADLDSVTAFFIGMDLAVETRMFVEGGFVDTLSMLDWAIHRS